MSKAYKPLPAAEDLWELFSYNPLTGNLHYRVRTANHLQVGDAVKGIDSNGYRRAGIKGTNYRAHRLVWTWISGEDPQELRIDHKNGDTLDNRLWNLRKATVAQNAANSRRYQTNTSGFKGISKSYGKWQAAIRCNGVKKSLGVFSTPEEAHQAYCEAAKRLHGDFARLG